MKALKVGWAVCLMVAMTYVTMARRQKKENRFLPDAQWISSCQSTAASLCVQTLSSSNCFLLALISEVMAPRAGEGEHNPSWGVTWLSPTLAIGSISHLFVAFAGAGESCKVSFKSQPWLVILLIIDVSCALDFGTLEVSSASHLTDCGNQNCLQWPEVCWGNTHPLIESLTLVHTEARLRNTAVEDRGPGRALYLLEGVRFGLLDNGLPTSGELQRHDTGLGGVWGQTLRVQRPWDEP